MKARTIGFCTSRDEASLTADDLLLSAPLRALGLEVAPLVWDAGTPVEEFAGLVVRSCWDYHLKVDAFRAWLEDLERRGVPVWNPIATLRWNLDKHYLGELAARGVATPRTVFVPQGPAPTLTELLVHHGMDQAVIKPAVSLSAYATWRTDRRKAAAQQPAFAALVAAGSVLLQEFIPEVVTAGELSLVFIERGFSHAVRKRPRDGDFRVQVDHGGTRERCEVSASIVAQAAAVLSRVDGPLLYARVDGIVVGEVLVLMELELIDPVLFLAYHDDAAERLARAIAARIAVTAA